MPHLPPIRRSASCVLALLIVSASVAAHRACAADQPTPSVADLDPDDPQIAGHFKGRVTDADSKPLRGARVYVALQSDSLRGEPRLPRGTGKLQARAETGPDGRFDFNVPDTTYIDLDGLPARRSCLLIATADGYAPDWVERFDRNYSLLFHEYATGIHAAEREPEYELKLAAGDVTIRGRFLDSGGRPVAGARVELFEIMVPQARNLDAYLGELKGANAFMADPSYECWLFKPGVVPGIAAEALTDSDGRFTLAGIGRDRLVGIHVSAPNVAETYLTAMTRDVPDLGVVDDLHGKPIQLILGANFTLRLGPCRTISGVVRDCDTHEPIAGMRADSSFRTGQPATTDAQGRFTISGLNPTPGIVKIAASSPPGMFYQSATAEVEDDKPVEINCRRGIPFHLKAVDEQGAPVDAEVTSDFVLPNPNAPKGDVYPGRLPLSRALRNADGSYSGFVLPGPCAILVKQPESGSFRPAHVDPKAFFAPGRTDWNAQERSTSYGTQNYVVTACGFVDQNAYAAIVLVNPAPDSKPLELSATLVNARPRQVTLVDADGKRVIGATCTGINLNPYDPQSPLRSSTFKLMNPNSDRPRRILFYKVDRQLVGFLLAQGDGDSFYTVRMQRWGTITGRILDVDGKPIAAWLTSDTSNSAYSDPTIGICNGAQSNADGRFRIERLVPGQHYTMQVKRGDGTPAGPCFENVVLAPGEVRDLGDIRLKNPVVAMSSPAGN